MIKQILLATILVALCGGRQGIALLPIPFNNLAAGTPVAAQNSFSAASLTANSSVSTTTSLITTANSTTTGTKTTKADQNPRSNHNKTQKEGVPPAAKPGVNPQGDATAKGTSDNSEVVDVADSEDAVIKVTTINIGLPVTVYDDKGRFVPNLKRENFQVLENNAVQPIISFHAQANLPLSVAIVMDTSTSVRNRLEFEKTAIKQFLAEVLRTERDRLAFMTFDSEIKLREDFTNDVAKVGAAVDGIKVIGGQTSLYDAIYKICRENMSRTSARRRVVVAISDGADTNSRHTLSQAIEAAQRTETTVYAISTKGGAEFRVEGTPFLNADDRDLRKLCRDTGGEVFFPDDAEKLKRAFQLVAEFLRNQYLIIYEPTSNADGKFHKIEVRIVGRKNLLTISRSGYTAN
jgi:Ca-activated chloride channel homolog